MRAPWAVSPYQGSIIPIYGTGDLQGFLNLCVRACLAPGSRVTSSLLRTGCVMVMPASVGIGDSMPYPKAHGVWVSNPNPPCARAQTLLAVKSTVAAISGRGVAGEVQAGPRAQGAVKRFSAEPIPEKWRETLTHTPLSQQSSLTKYKFRDDDGFQDSNHRALNSKHRALLSLRPCRTPN